MIVTGRIVLETRGECDVVDITPQVAAEVTASGVGAGMVTVFVAGSTAGVTTIEYEDGAVIDFARTWERIAPRGLYYEHDRRWGDGNGYAHIRASVLGGSLVVPFTEGRLLLGTWQQIVLVDFDNSPRSRQVVLQIIGE